MTPPDSNDDHLADLRRRWEEDPGSRIFLQLAEEYRRADRHEEALEVLEKGMEAHPRQVSGLVSLGRIHLALDQPAEAAEALEKAVEIDPTNPMAMKLATEAHLQAGDRAMAKQRLDLYKLLNAGDEDTENLEARVEGREPANPEPPRAQAGADDGAEDGPVGDDQDGAEGDDQGDADPGGEDTAPSWSPTAAWPGLPQGGDGEGAEVSEPVGASAAEPGAEPPSVKASEAADAVAGGYASEFSHRTAGAEADDDRPEPFADLLSEGGEGDYLSGLAAEGIFPLEEDALRRAREAAESSAGAGAAAGDAEEPFPDLAAAPDVESGDSPWDLVDEEDQPAVATEEADDGPRPTVTLGQLYLDQGHHAEALAIFEAVLDRDPGREAAAEGRRAALEAQRAAEGETPQPAAAPPAPEPVPDLAAQPTAEPTAPAPAAGFSLQAAELLRGADPSKPRKVALLEAYLDRIRGERAS